MPFSGGYSPSPERYGGGDGEENAPRFQRIFESLAEARGQALDQTQDSVVGAENAAFARAIEFDVYGANERFANEMNPVTSTPEGLLPRWEKIFGVSAVPGDPTPVRQARVAAAIARFGRLNNSSGVVDAVTAVLGALYVALVLPSTAQSQTWWPGYGGSAAKVTAISGNQITVGGLTNVPSNAPGKNLVLSNANLTGNNGTFLVQSVVSSTSVVAIDNKAFTGAPDYGVGGTSLAPTIVWSMQNPFQPWTSTLASVLVEVNPTLVTGLTNPDGSPNGKFYALVNAINPVLDLLLPSDVTFDWFVQSSHGGAGFYLDEINLDLEIFDV